MQRHDLGGAMKGKAARVTGGRRASLGAWAGLGAVLLSACAIEGGEGVEGRPEGASELANDVSILDCSADPDVTFATTFHPDPAMPNDRANEHDRSDEQCRVGAGRAALVGRQLRISATVAGTARVALCTVNGTHGLGDGTVTLNTESALSKLGISADTSGTTSNRFDTCGWVTEALASYDATASTTSSIGEFVHDPVGVGRVAFTAPHGGGIEGNTEQQVKFLDETAALNFNAYYWAVKGRGNTQRSRLHITSVDLSERSFDGLSHIANHQADIRQVVSFHGHGGGNCSIGNPLGDVLVGGGAPQAYREALANVIALYRAGAGLAASALTLRTDFSLCTGIAGADPDNYVNRFSDFSEGVQIEQSSAVRDDVTKRELVAEAVGNYVNAFNNDTVRSLGQAATSTPTTRSALALGAAFAVPANRAIASPNDYGSCSAGDTARVDWWRRIPGTNALSRSGGGALACSASGRWVPGAGFASWSIGASSSPYQMRFVAHAYKGGAVAPTFSVTVN